jgi:hypothetical protein
MEPIINKIIEYIEDDTLKERFAYEYYNKHDLILARKPPNNYKLYCGNPGTYGYNVMNACHICMVYDEKLQSCKYCINYTCTSHMEECVFCSKNHCDQCIKWKSSKPLCKKCWKQFKTISKKNK